MAFENFTRGRVLIDVFFLFYFYSIVFLKQVFVKFNNFMNFK